MGKWLHKQPWPVLFVIGHNSFFTKLAAVSCMPGVCLCQAEFKWVPTGVVVCGDECMHCEVSCQAMSCFGNFPSVTILAWP